MHSNKLTKKVLKPFLESNCLLDMISLYWMCSANRPTFVFIVEPYPPRTFYASPLSDTSLMVTLGYGRDPSVSQCSQFILLTDPESSKTVKPCPSTTSVRLDGLISDTNYQVIVMVETVPTSSGLSVSSIKNTTKSWTCTFFKIWICCIVMWCFAETFVRFVHLYKQTDRVPLKHGIWLLKY